MPSALAIESHVFFEDLTQVLPEGEQIVRLLLLCLVGCRGGRGRLLHSIECSLRLRRWRVRNCKETVVDSGKVHYLVFIMSEIEEGDAVAMEFMLIIC